MRILKIFMIFFLSTFIIEFSPKKSFSDSGVDVQNIAENFDITEVEITNEPIFITKAGVVHKKATPAKGYTYIIITYVLENIKNTIVINEGDFFLIDTNGEKIEGYIKVLSYWMPFGGVTYKPNKKIDGSILFVIKSDNYSKLTISFLNKLFPLKKYSAQKGKSLQ